MAIIETISSADEIEVDTPIDNGVSSRSETGPSHKDRKGKFKSPKMFKSNMKQRENTPHRFKRDSSQMPEGTWFVRESSSNHRDGDCSSSDLSTSNSSDSDNSPSIPASSSNTFASRKQRKYTQKRKDKNYKLKKDKKKLKHVLESIKFQQPSRWDGTADLELFDKWCYEVKTWASVNDIPDDLLVEVMINFLSGKAVTFFMKHVARYLEWGDGWCMVDGTLVPLFHRPYWYGESYFDRKCNYSLNLQVVSLPNLRIIDVGYGFTGSTHDSSAWQHTRFFKEREKYLERDEFIWADSAYPIESWLVAPYKKPEKDEPENELFNHQLSDIRIRSEHAIGFLKGRFQSLKDLRIRILDERTHKIATYWVLACVAVHNFALGIEAEVRGYSTVESDDEPFIRDGRSERSDEEIGSGGGGQTSMPVCESQRYGGRSRALAAGKEKHEKLKRLLFEARRKRNAGRRDSSSESDS